MKVIGNIKNTKDLIEKLKEHFPYLKECAGFKFKSVPGEYLHQILTWEDGPGYPRRGPEIYLLYPISELKKGEVGWKENHGWIELWNT